MSKGPLLRASRWVLFPLCSLSERLGNRFYTLLAVAVSLAGALAIAGNLTSGMKHQAFDLVMKHRFRNPPADPQIVIVDIDEAALAAMAPEYGRWPWPRSVLAELVQGISPQGPRAIVFDITFSDPDVYNAESDQFFRETVSQTPDTFFPMIRLNEENDRLSSVRLAGLAGVTRASKDAAPDATLAVVLPFLFETLDGNRLGTNNLYADDDGIVRSYHVYRDVKGWRVGSLPANLAAALGSPPPDRPDVLLNWRGKPGAYRTVSFHEVFFDLLNEKRTRPQHEFKDKIVIIGSTAPSLFDLKPSAVARIHPGVEILATAVDNLKNGDYLSEVRPAGSIVVTVLAVSLLGLAFSRSMDPELVNQAFTGVQGALLAVTYLVLNYSATFVDLTAPFSFGLAYFLVARANSKVLDLRKNGHSYFSDVLDEGRACQAFLVQCHLHSGSFRDRAAATSLLKRHIGLSRYGAASAGIFKPSPLLNAFLRDTCLLHWLVPRESTSAALQDLGAVLQRVEAASAGRAAVTFGFHSYAFEVDREGRWRLGGELALAELLALPGDAGPARGFASESFLALCRATDGGDLPPALRSLCIPSPASQEARA